jgi:hypothetical protein
MKFRTAAAVALGPLLSAPLAVAFPQVGAPFPSFEVRDLTGQVHHSRELAGRPTPVIVGSDTDGDVAMRAWGAAAERRLPTGAQRFTVLAFDLAAIVPSALARSIARDRVPERLWHSSWLDSSGELRPTLGVPESEVPFAFVLDARGRVVWGVQCEVGAPGAERIWRALEAEAARGGWLRACRRSRGPLRGAPALELREALGAGKEQQVPAFRADPRALREERQGLVLQHAGLPILEGELDLGVRRRGLFAQRRRAAHGTLHRP